jgi:hypothetical protein
LRIYNFLFSTDKKNSSEHDQQKLILFESVVLDARFIFLFLFFWLEIVWDKKTNIYVVDFWLSDEKRKKFFLDVFSILSGRQIKMKT